MIKTTTLIQLSCLPACTTTAVVVGDSLILCHYSFPCRYLVDGKYVAGQSKNQLYLYPVVGWTAAADQFPASAYLPLRSEPIVLYTFSTLAHSLICKIYALPLAQCFLYNASWTKHSEVSRSLSPLALVIIHLCTSYGIIGLLWKPRHAPLDNINENKFAIPYGRRIHCLSARRNVPDIPDNDTTWLYCVENLWIMQQNQGLDQQ